MANKLMRMLGAKYHRFKPVPSKPNLRRCKDCGEVQMKLKKNKSGPADEWYETLTAGDGSCGVPIIPDQGGY